MDVVYSLLRSYSESAKATGSLVSNAYSTLANPKGTKELAQTLFVLSCVFMLAYVFIIAPARAGLWTLPKGRKHKSHRYMGLFFLIQYSLAWIEFLTNYVGENGVAGATYIPHAVALNGTIQRTHHVSRCGRCLTCHTTSHYLVQTQGSFKVRRHISASKFSQSLKILVTIPTRRSCREVLYMKTFTLLCTASLAVSFTIPSIVISSGSTLSDMSWN
jgi:hypothetical protein